MQHGFAARNGFYAAALAATGSQSVGSHRSAGQVYGLGLVGRDLEQVTEITRAPGDRGGHTARLGVLVHIANLPPDHVVSYRGVPLTSVPRTVIDLARTLPFDQGVAVADSALHAPAASFAGDEFYPDLFDKAAVLACRLAWNHPLVDGNKRAAWAALVLFIDINGGTWDPDPPDVHDAEQAMLAVAAHEVDEEWMASWLRDRIRFS